MRAKPKILCVDDEPNVLHGLRRSLRGRFEVFTATSGEEALATLSHPLDVAVICSDMRMPGMDGAQFLARAAEVAPDATRVLLSGQSDLPSLVRVINSSGIYRFLVKPCERADLVRALSDAAEHHRLRRAEDELLEGTVAGSLKLLSEAFAMASPRAAASSARVQRLVARLAAREGVAMDWEMATAASLAGLGWLAVPDDVHDRLASGKPLDPEEEAMLARAPVLGADLVANLPRLQGVAEILRAVERPRRREPWIVSTLRLALRFVQVSASNGSPEAALGVLRPELSPEQLTALWEVVTQQLNPVLAIRRGELEVGMELAEPLFTRSGVLLMPAGITIGEAAMARLRNFAVRYGLREPIHVRRPPEDSEGSVALAG